MSKCIFITGTGTDVGKTYVTALIVKKLKCAGLNAGYFKAAVSGNERVNGKLVPGDAEFVNKIAGINGFRDNLAEIVPYVYEHALSPHLASRLEGNPVKMEVVRQCFENICEKYDYVTVEGSGGILCPIGFDDGELWLEDIIQELNLDSILVADAGLGTINHVVLTTEYMKQKGMKVKGIIFNHYHPGNVMEEDNIRMVEHRTGIKVIACVKDGDRELDMEVSALERLYGK